MTKATAQSITDLFVEIALSLRELEEKGVYNNE